MRTKKTHSRHHLLVAVTIICAAILTFFVYRELNTPVKYLLLLIFLVLTISQAQLLRHVLQQDVRLGKFKRLSRKLIRHKKDKRRDEKYALKILNHVNSTNSQSATHTTIWQKPLQSFSGDLAMACESQCGKKYTLLADLTGHGIAAAMGAAPVASIFRATAHRGLCLEEIVTELNNRLEQLLPSGFFCCAAVVVNDNGHVSVCNAGLPDILISNENGDIVDQVRSTQIPLGIQVTDEKNVQLFAKSYSTPHQLYAITDGLIETASANEETFDIDTLSELISTKNTGSRVSYITDRFEAFSKGSKADDDISIVEVMIC